LKDKQKPQLWCQKVCNDIFHILIFVEFYSINAVLMHTFRPLLNKQINLKLVTFYKGNLSVDIKLLYFSYPNNIRKHHLAFMLGHYNNIFPLCSLQCVYARMQNQKRTVLAKIMAISFFILRKTADVLLLSNKYHAPFATLAAKTLITRCC